MTFFVNGTFIFFIFSLNIFIIFVFYVVKLINVFLYEISVLHHRFV